MKKYYLIVLFCLSLTSCTKKEARPEITLEEGIIEMNWNSAVKDLGWIEETKNP